MKPSDLLRTRILRAMELKSWTIADLTRKCKVKRTTVSMFINAKSGLNFNHAYELSKAVGVSLDNL